MCRNIRKLRREDGAPTDEELRDAALQFVRKISGYRQPSKANEKAFERAVADVARASRRMFDNLVVGRGVGA
jgi:hypothetical protein